MKKTTFLTFIFSLIIMLVTAQKKKDLLLEIEALKSKLDSTQTDLATSQRNEKINAAKLTTLEEQITDLKKTNSSLLNNLNAFTEVSKKKSENVSKTLQSLKEKENQLKVINDALTSNDSLKLAVLTQFKKGLGEGVQIGLINATIIVNIPNTTLFGDNDKNFEVVENGKGILERLSKILQENAEMRISVQGNSNALEFKNEKVIDNWDLSARQAASIVRVLQTDYQIDPKRMEAIGKSEYATEGVDTVTRIIIDPGFDKFYALVREHMKNQS